MATAQYAARTKVTRTRQPGPRRMMTMHPTPPMLQVTVSPADLERLIRRSDTLVAELTTQVDHLRATTAKLDLHRDSIRAMRRNLTRLRPWQWRRRRNIEFQLAQIALTLGEER
jgi:septal ring factor EnvC (AmiA/AmiB activator)